MPPFDPRKHIGVWDIAIKDEKGNETSVKTNKLDIKAEMPYLEPVSSALNIPAMYL